VIKRCFLLLLLCLSTPVIGHAQQLVTEVIPLGYRTVNEVIPVIRPLVSPAGSITGLQGQLVVTATPQALEQVRKVLASLDKSPARLLISVRRGKSLTSKQGSASVQGRKGNIAINKGGIIVGSPPGGRHYTNTDKDSLAVKATSNRRTADMNITQQVQVLEGREAYISTGDEIPVRNRTSMIGPDGIYRYDSTEFYPAVTGFYTIPRLNGDEVFLEINTFSRKHKRIRTNGHYPRQGRQHTAVSDVRTSITGKLGEWIAIGNVDQTGAIKDANIAAISRQQQASSSQIYLRVEKIETDIDRNK
jgi:type II secretory pathway component GspD/PulD (secretin)